jgi:Beta-ketoacyl synthase, N-terminal domain
MSVAISSIGLASAQGSSANISNGAALCAPAQWPWPVNGWSTAKRCRPAVGVSSRLNGLMRWQALVQLALEDCLGDQQVSPDTPIFIGSCNGSAGDFSADSWSEAFDSAALLEGTAWAGLRVPVFSSSCNSGLHALYAANQVLLSGQADEAVVLGADILSPSNQDNFEVLRVLTDSPMPWQSTSTGFILGEAAVALKLVREKDGVARTRLNGPVLANELTRGDGLPRVLEQLSRHSLKLLLGQGTGPLANDESELAAFQHFIAADVPLATSLVHFGHTLGASGLLAIALAALIQQTPRATAALVMPTAAAIDGRPLTIGSTKRSRIPISTKESGDVLVSCRALNGSCAAAVIGTADNAYVDQNGRQDRDQRSQKTWHAAAPTGPLMNTLLRRIAGEAHRHRPVDPPDVLLVRMEEPLAPPTEARIGERLLPSAVLEMTPGFVSQLIARCWGFPGPALCVVGNSKAKDRAWDLGAALNDLSLVVNQVELRGTGDTREIAWDN